MRHLPAALIALALVFPAAAADTETRYQFDKSGDGYVRLDRQTGLVATCRSEGGQLVCRNSPDEIAAYDVLVGDLQDRVAQLEKEVAALRNAAPKSTEPGLPSDEEFERTLGLMEKFFRRFKDVIEEMGQGESQAPSPGRT